MNSREKQEMDINYCIDNLLNTDQKLARLAVQTKNLEELEKSLYDYLTDIKKYSTSMFDKEYKKHYSQYLQLQSLYVIMDKGREKE